MSIPMTGLTKAAPMGISTPAHTAPLLGTFVVMQPGAANPIVGVVINPVSVTVQIGVTQQFTANTVGLAAGVTWSALHGTISASGLYTAPTSVGSDTVTAMSTADPTKSASASVSITNTPPPPPPNGTPFVQGARVVVNAPSLNVRTGPDATLTPIGSVTTGDLGVVLAASTSNGFTDVQFDKGIAGFVLTVQLNPSNAPPPVNPPPPPPPPPPPTLHSVKLSWTPSTTAGVTGYRVYKSAVSGGPYTRIANLVGASVSGYTDVLVALGKTYFYVFTEVTAAGELVKSNEIVAEIPTGTNTLNAVAS